ncbi:MAG: hypothetical protein E3J72_00765 [Planctomycetota bacterium]|nr:MAG: hypothetical protein E3J72_00765 [Planctomycetota bacterium]
MASEVEAEQNLEKTENDEGETRADTGPYRWKVHLLRAQPVWKTAIFVLVLLGALVFAFVVFLSWVVVAIFAIVFFLTFEDYIFPLRFEIGPGGVSVKGALLYRRVMKWADIRRCAVNEKGVLCSPFEKPSRLDGIRGAFMRFGPLNCEEVISNVRRFRDAAHAA